MQLDSGTRLGPYQILGPVGAGGMGQVYRARDTRLEREVAIKVIAAEHEPSDEQRRRFAREARAVAQIAHPNICSLFDVGYEAGIDYLVMELLDGETLASRLRRGPIPIEQCARLGASIASALAAAHQRGIVHRDLKPANVVLTANGPKLLDFGLAKALAPLTDPSADHPADLTGTGVVVGTVPYMAPEQLEGRDPDARTDIFALGTVLYEMVTGRPAFSAPTPVALAAAVLASSPTPVSAVRSDAPLPLERLIGTCLEKDPSARWESARDLGLQLAALASERRTTGDAVRPRRMRRWLPWTVAAGALVLTGVVLSRSSGATPPPASPVRFTVDPPAGGGIAWSYEADPLALSPDGRQLAFIAFDSTRTRQVWVRPLSAPSAAPLPGTVGAQSVMWSPDGRSIAFFTEDRLARIDLRDGQPVTIARIASRSGQSGTWGRRDDILFGGVQGEAIHRVPAGGGTPEVVLQPDPGAGEARVSWPSYLPDGERFLYTLRRTDGEAVLMLATPGEPSRTVTKIESLAQYAGPGLIAFVRDGALIGQRFDAGQARVGGEPFAIAEGVRYFLSTGAAARATSSAGETLAFQAGRDLQRLVWLDREGVELGPAGPAGNYLAAAFSPDGRRLLTTREEPKLGTWDIGLIDLERGTETPVTTARDTETYGIWLPDGRSVVYSVVLGSAPNLVRRDLASAAEVRLAPAPEFQVAVDLSPDGRTLLYRRRPADRAWDFWTMPVEGGAEPSLWRETPYSEIDGRFSPDGQYLALISDETGRPELYLSSFAAPGEKARLSTAGAVAVRWPRESGEIIYVSPAGQVVAVPVETGPVLRVGAPAILFTVESASTWSTFDVTPDGRRFLAAIPVVTAANQPITVIASWATAAVR